MKRKNYRETSTFLNNDNACVKALIQNIRFKTKKTECTESRKTSFQKEWLENGDLHKPVKPN